jgi:VCBS repeat-containing protein
VDSGAVAVSITVTPVNDTPAAIGESYSVNQGATLTVAAPGVLGNDTDPEGDSLTTVLVTTATKGTLTLNANGGFTYTPQASATASDTFTYRAKDATLESGTATVTIAINAVSAPLTVGSITWNVSVDPVKVGMAITGTATASATGAQTATWNWGDGTTSPGTINGTAVIGAKTYAAAGIYTVRLAVTDQHGASAESVYRYVVVNNPAAGYEHGAGFFNSTAGAYTANPALTGTANINQLQAKYKLDGTLTGITNNFQFSYTPANLSFKSSSLTWLVMSGSKSWLKGEGAISVNGTTQACYFLLAVVDSTTVADQVRVKIWTKTTGAIIYDNMQGAPDDAEATRPTTGPLTVTFVK